MSHLTFIAEYESLHSSRVGRAFELKICEFCGILFLRDSGDSRKYGPCCIGKEIRTQEKQVVSSDKLTSSTRTITFPRLTDSERDPQRQQSWLVPPVDDQTPLVVDQDPDPVRLPKRKPSKPAARHSAPARQPRKGLAGASPSGVHRVSKPISKRAHEYKKGCHGKFKHLSRALAEEHLRDLKRKKGAVRHASLGVYPCPFGDHFHIGHNRNKHKANKGKRVPRY